MEDKSSVIIHSHSVKGTKKSTSNKVEKKYEGLRFASIFLYFLGAVQIIAGIIIILTIDHGSIAIGIGALTWGLFSGSICIILGGYLNLSIDKETSQQEIIRLLKNIEAKGLN